MNRIVFMGTPDFAVPSLQALLDTQHVVGVVTQPDRPAGRGQQVRPSPVKILAAAADVPVYQPNSLRSEQAAAPLQEWRPDLIVVAAFGQILRPHVLSLPRMGCLNVHASLLPRWRGASPIQHAILAGDAMTGITLMQMDVGLDTGAIYVQESIPISPDETAATLHDKLARLGAGLLKTYLPAILQGQLKPTPQEDALSTYAPMIKKKDGRLDWSQASRDIQARIRAMTPWPGAFTSWNGYNLKIVTASVAETTSARSPGTVAGEEGEVVVAAGQGGVRLHAVQLAGKRVMAITDFLRGRPEFIGSVLE